MALGTTVDVNLLNKLLDELTINPVFLSIEQLVLDQHVVHDVVDAISSQTDPSHLISVLGQGRLDLAKNYGPDHCGDLSNIVPVILVIHVEVHLASKVVRGLVDLFTQPLSVLKYVSIGVLIEKVTSKFYLLCDARSTFSRNS